MEIKHLRLIKAVVEFGSLSKAKDYLHLTQSALSHQLKEVESQTGVELFERCNKKLILTQAGNTTYETAVSVLKQVDNLNDILVSYKKDEHGCIKVSTSCFTNFSWLPGLTKLFAHIHPNIEIRIIPIPYNNAINALYSHELDVVISNKPDDLSYLDYIEVKQDEMIALMAPGHPWSKKKYVVATDFAEENLVIFSGPMNTVHVYSKVLQPAHIEPRKIYEVPMTEAMIDMVAAGIGVCVIPYWVAKPYIKQGKVVSVKVTPKGLARSLGVVRQKKNVYPKYHDTFISFIKENLYSI
jgi:LysR family transcriptional regulator, regulator for metE and metH